MLQTPIPDYEMVSGRLKLLAHPERLRILDVLRRDAECVCHLEALLGKPQPYVSQQLRFLRQSGLILDEKEGQNVYYRLADAEIVAWLDLVLGPVAGEHPEMAAHKKVIACPCPKCAETPSLIQLEAVTTIA
ncbi:MAG: metalloregulator ArsR/SmtB family transcription factor [Caldilineaceae bacterium]